MTDKFDEEARRILGGCTCHEAYTLNKLTAPDCVFCNYGEEVGEALRTAHADGMNEGLERAAKQAKVAWLTAPELDDGRLRDADGDMTLCDYAAKAIRALKTEDSR